jgi:phosphoserine aminotransferase
MTKTTSRVFNFSAGPATLPKSVLEQIQSEMLSLPGAGSSVLEISHRSPEFDSVLDDAKSRIAQLTNLPDTHEVLFLQGGSALQNVMMPMNFLTEKTQTADVIVTGAWGKKTAAEIFRFGHLNIAWDGNDSNYNRVPDQSELNLTPNAAYCHLTSNETIHGVKYWDLPETGDVPLLVDKSSDLFSEPIDIARYGLIYACAQKNAGIAGVNVLILKKELLDRCDDRLPSYLDYSKHSKAGSRFNTPPTFAIYVTGLVCKWLQEEMGGLANISKFNQEKASLLYNVIDQSNGFYSGHAAKDNRSIMNVVFTLETEDLESQFLAEATDAGMTSLKGHRSLGGIRASVYNAMPMEGVESLVQFMTNFTQKNG